VSQFELPRAVDAGFSGVPKPLFLETPSVVSRLASRLPIIYAMARENAKFLSQILVEFRLAVH